MVEGFAKRIYLLAKALGVEVVPAEAFGADPVYHFKAIILDLVIADDTIS